MGERVGGDRHLRHSHEVSLGWRNIRCEVSREMALFYPPVPIAIRLECLGSLWHCRFDRRTALTFIESECGNIYECRNVWIVAGLGDDGPAVAVADQHDWATHCVDCSLRVLLVVGVRGLWGLRNRYRVAILLKDLCDGIPAGAIGEGTVDEHDVFDTSGRRLCRGDSVIRPQPQSCGDQGDSERRNTIKVLHDD